ncbi:MAG: ABC transporter substrate-binding protein [Pseudomonadota bacterium]|nr:ABC transporter substrate-binding protein [Pseudomonadota bacterium]
MRATGKTGRIVAFFAMLAVALPLWAASAKPREIVEGVIDELVGQMNTRRTELQADTGKLYAMVDRVVLPHFDFRRMSRLVLGKNWKKASAAQQERFTKEFRDMLVRTYATAMFEYTGKESIKYKPTKYIDERRAEVDADVILADGQQVPVIYSFLKLKTGEWKLYNLTINGISLVMNYRTTYNDLIRARGLDAVIQDLASKNHDKAIIDTGGKRG